MAKPIFIHQNGLKIYKVLANTKVLENFTSTGENVLNLRQEHIKIMESTKRYKLIIKPDLIAMCKMSHQT